MLCETVGLEVDVVGLSFDDCSSVEIYNFFVRVRRIKEVEILRNKDKIEIRSGFIEVDKLALSQVD